ncbi:hypothetical protein pipiens_008280, partial [Culex pipiens pipiens]
MPELRGDPRASTRPSRFGRLLVEGSTEACVDGRRPARVVKDEPGTWNFYPLVESRLSVEVITPVWMMPSACAEDRYTHSP